MTDKLQNPIVIKPFQTCPACKKVWGTRVDFLDDPEVVYAGYLVHFDQLSEGLFHFNHSCKTTISLKSGVFRDLYDGPIFETRLTGADECPEYCLIKHELRPCPAKCECAYIREIMQLILAWPKKNNEEE